MKIMSFSTLISFFYLFIDLNNRCSFGKGTVHWLSITILSRYEFFFWCVFSESVYFSYYNYDFYWDQEENGLSSTASLAHGILFLCTENVTETSGEMDDVLYQSNTTGIDALLKWRGIGLTLSHLLPQLTRSLPVG